MSRCPDDHRWWECKHEELAMPVLGSIMMSVGGFVIGVGILEILGFVR